MPKRKLTAKNVKTLPAKNGRRVDYHDKTLPGFMLRVSPNGGARSYAVRYDVRNVERRKRRYMKIGSARVMKLADARDEARKILNEVARGGDPAVDWKDPGSPEIVTVGDLLDDYLEEHAKAHRPAASEDDKRRAERIKAEIGKVALERMTTTHADRVHDRIAERGRIEANRTTQLLSLAFDRAVRKGYIDPTPNPVKGVERFDERPRDRVVEQHELPRLLDELSEVDNEVVRAFFLLTLLVGARKNEMRLLRWEHVNDLDGDQPALSITPSKTGRRYSPPLSSLAVRVLKSIPRKPGNPYLFAGHHEEKPVSESTINRRWWKIRKAADIDDVTIHDLRRTCGTAISKTVPEHIVKVALGHKSVSTATQIYMRPKAEDAREAFEAWGQKVAAIMDDESDATAED